MRRPSPSYRGLGDFVPLEVTRADDRPDGWNRWAVFSRTPTGRLPAPVAESGGSW